MKSTTCDADTRTHVALLLRLADDALILAQRLSHWCGHGPVLEEELAMANIGLDLIGQARMLYSHAGAIEGAGRDEDRLAYFRGEAEFGNLSICELPNGRAAHDDYAVTIVRNLLCSARAIPLWRALTRSSDPTLAAIAAKAGKEAAAHLRHASDWTIRFGGGTDESARRAQHALDRLWPYTNEFWRDDEIDRAAAAAGLAPLPSSIREPWEQTLGPVIRQARLRRPPESEFVSTGRLGRHTEYLGPLLAEMQSVARAHPQGRW